MLFNGSVYDNILYGRLDATPDEVKAAAKAANADEFISQLPQGYATMLGDRGTIKNADKILVLEHGALVEAGTHDELIAKNGLYAHLYQIQYRSKETK